MNKTPIYGVWLYNDAVWVWTTEDGWFACLEGIGIYDINKAFTLQERCNLGYAGHLFSANQAQVKERSFYERTY